MAPIPTHRPSDCNLEQCVQMHHGIEANSTELEKIKNGTEIHQWTFMITTSVFFAVAMAAALGRLITRLCTRLPRPTMLPEDYTIIVAVISLACAYAMLLMEVEGIFYADALMRNVIHGPDSGPRLEYNAEVSQDHNIVFVTLLWVTISAVKATFLLFFWPLMNRRTRRLRQYYWAVWAFTTLSSVYLVFGNFVMLCPHYGNNAGKCFAIPEKSVPEKFTKNIPNRLERTLLALNFYAILDIASDSMIVSIPLLALRGLKVDRLQRLGLTSIMCLSVVMIIIALIRTIGTFENVGVQSGTGFPLVWTVFWSFLEGCAAVCAASVVILRAAWIKFSNNRRNSGNWFGPRPGTPGPLLPVPNPTLPSPHYIRQFQVPQLPSLSTGSPFKGRWPFNPSSQAPVEPATQIRDMEAARTYTPARRTQEEEDRISRI